MGRRRAIVLLVLTSILLITLDVRGSAMIDRTRSLFALLVEPFDTAARTVTRPVLTAWHGVVDYRDVQRENEELRAEIDNQRGAIIEARAAILVYQVLLVLNRLMGSSNFPSVTVQVQGDAPGNFQNTIEINKGSVDGIAVGMPVVSGAGLVGKVTQVFPNSAIVLLVVDPGFSIGAKVLTPIGPVPVPSTTLPLRPTEQEATTSTTTTTLPPSATTSTTTPSPRDPMAPVQVSTTSTLPASVTATTLEPIEVLRETGLVFGQGAKRPMVLRFIDDSATTGRIAVGSTVETAGGLRSNAPPGIPIGTVSSVTQQSGSRVPVIEVEISAGDLSKLNFLRVLLYVPNTTGN
jgi:rod shape-determining protein MreC